MHETEGQHRATASWRQESEGPHRSTKRLCRMLQVPSVCCILKREQGFINAVSLFLENDTLGSSIADSYPVILDLLHVSPLERSRGGKSTKIFHHIQRRGAWGGHGSRQSTEICASPLSPGGCLRGTQIHCWIRRFASDFDRCTATRISSAGALKNNAPTFWTWTWILARQIKH